MTDTPTLHMLCGKMASGKSSVAAELGKMPGTILISEDDWLGGLFADEMTTGADYVRCSAKLRAVIGPHVATLLNAGVSVVLDFPANTPETRVWMRDVLTETNATHQMHVLDTPDEVCLARLRARNARGDHPFAPTEEQFHRFSKHFSLPSPDEGFTLVVHRPEDQG